MNRRSPVVRGVALVALICGCAGAPAATPSPAATATPTPLVTAAPTATPPPTATPAPSGPQPLRMGILPAGAYITNRFVPQFTLTLPDGWSQFFPDEDDEIYMGSADAEIAISRAANVVDPVSHSAVDAPEDLTEWLAQHPAFNNPEPEAIVLGGIDSFYFDLPGPAADTDLFSFPEGDFHIPPGVATRVYILPQDGLDISFVVLPEANTGTIEAAIEAAHPIVESVQIGD